MSAFITMWRQDQLEIERESGSDGQPLDHTAGSRFQRSGVASGDRIYVTAIEPETNRLLLVGRIQVDRIGDQREAERLAEGPVYEAPEHVFGRGTPIALDRVVPETTARRIERASGRPLRIAPDVYRVDRQTLRTTGQITAASAALFDELLEEPQTLPIDAGLQPEGSPRLRLHWAAERSRAIRDAAFAIHGFKCQVCSFLFSDVYGELGARYAEVHHLVPLGSLKRSTLTNPATDTVVLCANCHRMVHQREPPLTPDELRERL